MPFNGLWVPPSSDPMTDLRAQLDTERQAYAESRVEHIEHLNKELRAIDPYLELVKVREDAPDDDVTVIPGFWHVVRHNPGAPDTWMPVTGEDGQFAEPTSRIFDKLAEGDMWRDEFGQRARKRQADRQAAKEREKESTRMRLAAEFDERLDAVTKVRVSFSLDHAWTQNRSANGRRDAATRKNKA